MKSSIKKMFVALLITIITSCAGGGGSSSSSSGGGGNGGASVYSITIDNTGTVPILGSSATSSVVYIHNNTTTAISGISYSSQNNTASVSTLNTNLSFFAKFLGILGLRSTNINTVAIRASSANLCSSIPAGQSCPLSFTTPVPTNGAFQGSSLITASYSVNGQSLSFSQILDYASVSSSSTSGALFSSSVNMTAYPGITPYATVYLYGSGIGESYTVNSLSLDKPSLAIVQGNITGQAIVSNYVQAVEISGPVLANGGTGITGTITAQSTDNATTTTFNAQSMIGIQSTPASNGAILNSGLSPLINMTGVSSSSGIIPIINSGNTSATSVSIAYPTGVVANGGTTTCGATIAANASCNIGFTVNSTTASGSGNIVVTYSGGSAPNLSQTVTWYSSSAPLVGIASSQSPLVFNASESLTAVITVTNYGSINVSNVTLPTPTVLSGSGSIAALSSGDTCTGATLVPNASCQFSVSTTAAAATSGQVQVNFSGSYNNGSIQSYTRILVLSYTANASAPSLTITVPSLSIVGNNTESQTVTVTVANNGSAVATISANALVGGVGYITTAGTCVGTLGISGTCTAATVKLGPTTSSTTLTPTGESYSVIYYGGTISSGSPVTSYGAVNATVQPNNQSIAINSVPVIAQSSSGTGASGTPYIFLGSNTATKTATITYVNTGGNAIQITGVSNTNSPYNWLIDTTNSTCYNSGALPSATIAASGSCTLVFTNVLANNFIGLGSGLGSSYTMNLTLPTIVFKDTVATGTQFSVTPALPSPLSGTILYATAQQATLSSSITQAVGAAGNVTVTNTLANASGYANITVTTNMEDYFTGSPTMSNCTQNNTTESGVRTQICTLGPSQLVGSGIYALGSTAYESQNLDTVYSISTSGQVVSVGQMYGQLLLH